jgi:hypothetical protein
MLKNALTVNDIVALTNAKEVTANVWRGLCPLHEKSVTLRIGTNPQDGKILLRCSKGCDFRELILELRFRRQAVGGAS